VVCNASKQSSPRGSAPSYTEGNLEESYSGGETFLNCVWSGLHHYFRVAQAGIKIRLTTVAGLAAETNLPAYSESSVMHRAINSYRLLIIDEIGYLPMNREQTNLFFQVIVARCRAESEYCVSKQKSLYSNYALLSPHLAIALYIQPSGCAAAARRALNIHPHGFEAGGIRPNFIRLDRAN